MLDNIIVGVIIVSAFVLFVSERWRVDFVALAVLARPLDTSGVRQGDRRWDVGKKIESTPPAASDRPLTPVQMIRDSGGIESVFI